MWFNCRALVVFLLLCLSVGGERTGQWLQYGEGAKFNSVVWYHFPKTGGTSMRKLVHKFCKVKGFNMSSVYGTERKNDLENNEGTKPYFTYGHNSLFTSYDTSTLPFNGIEYRRNDILYIFMIRSPLPWMISRHQHYLRKVESNSRTPNFMESLISFGQEYFRFLDPRHRTLVDSWFEKLIKRELLESERRSVSRVEPDLDDLNRSDSPVGIVATLDNLLFDRRKQNVVVLIQEYYKESLEILDHVFGTNHFSSSSRYRYNTVRESQDKDSALGSVADVEAAMRLLEMHQALYYLCMQHFISNFNKIQEIA